MTDSVGYLVVFDHKFLCWLGVSVMELDFRIYIPILTFFWFFTHLVEAFVIQHYMGKNVPKSLEDMQI